MVALREICGQAQLSLVERDFATEKVSPKVFLVHALPWLNQIKTEYNLPELATLDDVPDAAIAELTEQGTHVYLMGIYQRGEKAHEHALQYKYQLIPSFPDLRDEDVPGSAFAHASWSPDKHFAKGWSAIGRFHERLNAQGAELILDFVANHVGIDHPITRFPGWMIHRAPEEAKNYGDLFFETRDRLGNPVTIAHGRDPYFPHWADTAQINPAGVEFLGKENRAVTTREMMSEVAQLISRYCDGLRCDMASLLEAELFTQFSNYNRRGWGEFLTDIERQRLWDEPFWPYIIDHVRQKKPNFLFIAEAYEQQPLLHKEGFNYDYDEDLYHLFEAINGGNASVRDLVQALHVRQRNGYGYPTISYVENHDKDRATRVFGLEQARAFSTVLAFSGLPLIVNQGQFEGRMHKASVKLAQFPPEPINQAMQGYDMRLRALERELRYCGKPEILAAQGPIVIERIRRGSQDVYICTNLSDQVRDGNLPIYRDVHFVHDYNLTSGQEFPDAIIDHNLDDGFALKPGPYETQVVYADY